MQVRVMGYNLGSSRNDIVSFSIRGVDCSTLRRESSNSLVCVSGSPVITTDLGAVRYKWPVYRLPRLRLSELRSRFKRELISYFLY